MLELVEPVDHKYPLALEEVSVIELPVHVLSGPLDVTVGVVGGEVAFTVVVFEVAEQVPDVIVTL